MFYGTYDVSHSHTIVFGGYKRDYKTFYIPLTCIQVILCGGAINSPQLLMLSGIGPADHLRDVGIESLVNLPGVGENLQDHIEVFTNIELVWENLLSCKLIH